MTVTCQGGLPSFFFAHTQNIDTVNYMKRFVMTALSVLVLTGSAYAQVGGENNINQPIEFETIPVVDNNLVDVAAETPFARAVAKAARKMRREGKITRLQQIRLRVAMLSPAFRQHAQELAVIQMAYSGAEVPTLDDGKIDVASINFEGLLDFIERLIPLIMKLMEIFSQLQ